MYPRIAYLITITYLLTTTYYVCRYKAYITYIWFYRILCFFIVIYIKWNLYLLPRNCGYEILESYLFLEVIYFSHGPRESIYVYIMYIVKIFGFCIQSREIS